MKWSDLIPLGVIVLLVALILLPGGGVAPILGEYDQAYIIRESTEQDIDFAAVLSKLREQDKDIRILDPQDSGAPKTSITLPALLLFKRDTLLKEIPCPTTLEGILDALH